MAIASRCAPGRSSRADNRLPARCAARTADVTEPVALAPAGIEQRPASVGKECSPLASAIDSGLPLLDLSRLDGGQADRGAFLRDLRDAAREVDFFCLAGHGVPDSFVARVLDESRRFFALPEAEKLSVAMIHSPHFRGYTRAGQELTRGRPDWRSRSGQSCRVPTRRPGRACRAPTCGRPASLRSAMCC